MFSRGDYLYRLGLVGMNVDDESLIFDEMFSNRHLSPEAPWYM